MAHSHRALCLSVAVPLSCAAVVCLPAIVCSCVPTERVIFTGFSEKLPPTSVYSVRPPGLDSTTGKPLAAVPRVDGVAPLSQLGLDSLDLVELMVAVEREFHIELQDQEHDSIKCVNDVVDMIHGHPKAY